ncbi:unnamed protein product [Arabidopsis halleri]
MAMPPDRRVDGGKSLSVTEISRDGNAHGRDDGLHFRKPKPKSPAPDAAYYTLNHRTP